MANKEKTESTQCNWTLRANLLSLLERVWQSVSIDTKKCIQLMAQQSHSQVYTQQKCIYMCPLKHM